MLQRGTESKNPETNLYKKYGLPSPPRGEFRRDDPKDTIKAMKKDGFGEYTKKDELRKDKSRVLFFLYSRGFCRNENRNERISKIKKIIEIEEVLERAVRIASVGVDKDVTRERQEQYKALSMSVKAYLEQPGAFGLRSSTGALKYYFRIQQAGNCFLLAPCIGVGYLMQTKGSEQRCEPLDLTQFVRHSFDDEKLFKYLADDAGGDPETEFNAMLEGLSAKQLNPHFLRASQLGSSEFISWIKALTLERFFTDHGPCIVSNFDVHKRFEKFDGSEPTAEGKIGYVQFSGPKIHGRGEFVELLASQQARDEVEHTLHNYQKNLVDEFNDAHGGDDENRPALDEGGRVGVSVSADLVDNENAPALDEAEDVEVSVSGVVHIGNTPAFDDDETVSETENPRHGDGKSKQTGRHAMLLIGGRRDANNRLWFLLQNWWTDMQLVEVSAAYLKASGARILFANPDYEFAPADDRKEFSQNPFLFADANNFDRAVQMGNGMSPRMLQGMNR